MTTNPMERLAALGLWLDQQLPARRQSLDQLADEASLRRFFRVRLENGQTCIAMDAPPDVNDIRPFLDMAARLASVVRVPAIHAHDVVQGFVLMEDLGSIDLAQAVQDGDEARAGQAYRAACQALIDMQLCADTAGLVQYDAHAMGVDLDRFTEWYVDKHLAKSFDANQAAVWARSRALLLARAASQPQTLIHFDFHSRNLVVEQDRIGIVDFQDARIGPITYDLTSLLKDMYVVWPEAFRLDQAIRYWQKARSAGLPVSEEFADFYREFEFMGVYRQLRTLGTFARLIHRDGKTRYAEYIPTALCYLRETCERYVELHPLYKLLNQLTGFTVQTGYTF